MLLAATLRQHCDNAARVTAFVPTSGIPTLSPLLRDVFKATGTEVHGFSVRSRMWRKPYPHGNKIIACAAAQAGAAKETRRITFLDTDMICTADLIAALPTNDTVAVVPEGKPTWGENASTWQRAYDFFDLPLPEERVHLVRGRKREFLPYFNAGMVSFPTFVRGKTDTGFAEAWADTASRFDRCGVAGKRPWLDQISLPLTFYREGFAWTALGESYNYSLSERKRKRLPAGVKILHYHRGLFLKDYPSARDKAVLAVLDLLPPGKAASALEFLEACLGLGLSEEVESEVGSG